MDVVDKARAAADRLEKKIKSKNDVTRDDVNKVVQAVRNLADEHETYLEIQFGTDN